MSVSDDNRKLLQDLIAPDLKAIAGKLDTFDISSRLRDDALSAKMDAKFELVLARMDAQHATVMNALAVDKRLEVLERVQQTQH